MHDFSFRKEERLKSRKVIGKLFQRQGISIGQYPLRLIFMPMEERQGPFPMQFTLSVPKRKFPKASARNRIRRQVREAWRLNKHRAYRALDREPQQYAFMILYVANEAQSFQEIERAMRQLISRFLKKRRAGNSPTNPNR